ncbi:apoptosis inhibitory protein 5-domain-containing protein [Gloeopeniophorella convolvens]|nr:apoptosis inhibitory protein 5-domain-containing protein [Gloeopeniophorella convolvens]
MPGSPADQEREATDLLRRAEQSSPDTNPVRRDGLRHAIGLSHSPHASLKHLAARNIAKFFKAFPDLEEDAINAIYDLCEDQDSSIRIEGYQAVVQMSKEQPKWVKRNVDVLVQLLQSDEPEEVAVVKTALIEHLELDSRVTLNVLCDQIVPPDEPMEDEDRVIRDRLRALVVAFLAGEAKKPLLDRLHSQDGAKQEHALINVLFKAISKFGKSDATRITKDILVSLPSFNGRSTRRGNDLLRLLLEQASASLKDDLAPGRTSVKLERTHDYLELSNFLCCEKSVSDPIQLLRFYCTSSLMGKLTLQRLSTGSRLFFLVQLADALAACDRRESLEPDELDSMRKQVVDALSVLLPFFVQIDPSDVRAWRSCEILLRACQQRKEQDNWSVPGPLQPVLVDISRLAAEQQNPDLEQVEELSRSLIHHGLLHPLPAKPPPQREASAPADPSVSKRKAEDELRAPQDRHRTLSIRGQHARQQQSKGQPRQHSEGRGTPPSVTAETNLQQSLKRLRTDEEKPSLLMRMGPPLQRQPTGRGRHRSKSGSPPAQQRPDPSKPAGAPSPTLGISIKGAARANSLLERIQGDGS